MGALTGRVVRFLLAGLIGGFLGDASEAAEPTETPTTTEAMVTTIRIVFLTEFGNMALGWGADDPGPASYAAVLSNAEVVIRGLNASLALPPRSLSVATAFHLVHEDEGVRAD